jgi:hypothetical protein
MKPDHPYLGVETPAELTKEIQRLESIKKSSMENPIYVYY